MRLETEQLVLRKPRLDAVGDVAELYADPVAARVVKSRGAVPDELVDITDPGPTVVRLRPL